MLNRSCAVVQNGSAMTDGEADATGDGSRLGDGGATGETDGDGSGEGAGGKGDGDDVPPPPLLPLQAVRQTARAGSRRARRTLTGVRGIPG